MSTRRSSATRSQLQSLRSKIFSKGRNTIMITRPAVPHLHLVNLRPQEKLINKVLFTKTEPDTDKTVSEAPTTMVKQIVKK